MEPTPAKLWGLQLPKTTPTREKEDSWEWGGGGAMGPCPQRGTTDLRPARRSGKHWPESLREEEGQGHSGEFPGPKNAELCSLHPTLLRGKATGRVQRRTLDRLLMGRAFQKLMTPLLLWLP